MEIKLEEVEYKKEGKEVLLDLEIESYIQPDPEGADYYPDLVSFEIEEIIEHSGELRLKRAYSEKEYKELHDFLRKNCHNLIIDTTIGAWENYDPN